MTKITTARIHFDENGTPISEQFDDIYFSKENGLTESEYVFQQGNQLSSRWQTWQNHQFTIAETGFGTGLNFLAVCQKFSQFRQQHPDSPLKQIQFISFEKYPLNHTKLTLALKSWNNLKHWSEQLLAQYPYLIEGIHRLELTQNIKLDLCLGDIQTQLPKIINRHNGLVDAWFLDGFAPSKNKDMWQVSLFNQMARLTKPTGTLATFTAAGFVRRGLVEAGFDIQKIAGYGKKREMLIGKLSSDYSPSLLKSRKNPAPYYPLQSSLSKNTTIIGGGIAAICTALTLAKRGHQIHLICENDLADGASGNHQGAIYPHLQNDLNSITECHLNSYEYACHFYKEYRTQFDFAADFCGVVQLAFSDKMAQRQASLINNPIWPTELFKYTPMEQMADLCGLNIQMSGIHFPNGGWLNPVSFIQSAVKYLIEKHQLKLSINNKLIEIHQLNNNQNPVENNLPCWQLTCQQKEGRKQIFNAENLILTNGWQLNQFSPTQHLSVEPGRGQVSYLKTDNTLNQLKKVISHKGYLTPQYQGIHCVGATFERNNQLTHLSSEDDLANLTMHQQCLPQQKNWLIPTNITASRASVRATTADRMPLLGNVSPLAELTDRFSAFAKGSKISSDEARVYPNLFVLAGLGSRGLTTAPLMAECLAAIMANEGLPLSQTTLEALHPNRFVIRGMKRGLYGFK